jgi:hypothetical protein
MTTRQLGKLSLGKVWEKFNEYVSNELMYDNSLSEISGFPEWAEMHFGIDQEAATDWFCEHAAEQMG